MSEYIIDWNENLIIDTFSKNSLREEIVRCRDCKYYHECWDFCERLKPGMVVEPDGFCAWGERNA